MNLFTKDINQKLFAQYKIGSDLNKQKVVAKIFNPYGIGRWYLLNSDPNDPDYLWAIVQMGDEVEIGSVSRSELESIRIKPHGLPLERDMYFSERNAMEVLDGLEKGKTFASGGMVPGRWYKDNSGNELRFIGESDGQLLFKDGDKLVKKSEVDFDGGKEEFKLFKWFKDGGETKQIVKLEPITTRRDKKGFRLYSTNDGNTIYAEKNGKIHNVSEDSLNILGEVPLRRSRFEFVGIISDEDTENLYPLHYEYKTMGRVRDKFKMADGGIIEIGSEGMYRGGAAKVLKYDDKNKMYAIKYLNEDGEIDGDFVMARKDDFEYGFSDFEPKMADGGKVPKYSVTFQYESKSKRAGWASFDSEDIYVDAKSSKEAKEKAIKIFNDKHPNIVGKITNINDNKSTFLDNANLAKGGMMEHGLRIGDKITTDMFWDNKIVVENVKTHKRAEIDLNNGKRKDEMAMGGKVTFNDKVKAIQKKLLANKKVPKSVQKDYGKTYDKAEAKESAQRIVGSQTYKWKQRNKK
jgi:hypothetical protein